LKGSRRKGRWPRPPVVQKSESPRYMRTEGRTMAHAEALDSDFDDPRGGAGVLLSSQPVAYEYRIKHHRSMVCYFYLRCEGSPFGRHHRLGEARSCHSINTVYDFTRVSIKTSLLVTVDENPNKPHYHFNPPFPQQQISS
jgi:hypothetical protein